MPSWESYFDEMPASELGKDEPQTPAEWTDVDPLMRGREQFHAGNLRDWLGWTYLSWRRLASWHRYQTRMERALVAMASERKDDYLKRIERIYGIAIGHAWGEDFYDFSSILCVLLHSDVPVPIFFAPLPTAETLKEARITELHPGEHKGFPVIAIPRVSFARLTSVSKTPTVSSNTKQIGGHTIRLHSGKDVYGQSPAGVLTPGSAAMFVERSNGTQPCLLSARHVLGTTGAAVVDAAQNQVGQVTLEDQILDASVADLTPPWVVDYQLPGLNIIPGAPLMPYVNMPVQMFGAKSGHQTGYVTQTNHTAPSRPGLCIANNILTSIPAQRGDSGALLCSGYYAQPGLAGPYLSATPPQIRDFYTCAAVGVLQGQATQGVGPSVGLPSVFTYIPDILASLNLDPLIR